MGGAGVLESFGAWGFRELCFFFFSQVLGF